ncbi:MAG: hypothetical protein GYB66_01210 [Chloroflexi bacterium]|nr:hypothetical protein [Chloroflexota bacterium]
MSDPFVATIRPGVRSDIQTVNVRTGPGTNFPVAFEAPVQTSGLRILDVRPDADDGALDRKVFQWFRLAFPDRRIGWVRDDLLDIYGDGSAFGYGVLPARTYAFSLRRAEGDRRRARRSLRDAVRRVQAQNDSTTAPSDDGVLATDDQERVINAAFNITAAFEGGGYDTYQTYDRGLISYGRFQFTLQSGSLASVIERYITLAGEDSPGARALMRDYLDRIAARDANLRVDSRLKAILQRLAEDPAMQQAQDQVAREQYWTVVYDLSVAPRGIRTPLAQAMFFDIGIQHGTYHGLFSRAERELGVPYRSRVDENGVSEAAFVNRVARVRQEILYAIAAQQGLPGVRNRADFWLKLIRDDDWDLLGDEDGKVVIFGRQVPVRNP